MEVLVSGPDLVVRHIRRPVTAFRHRAAVGALEEPAVAVVFLDAEAALVHQRMVLRAEQEEVGEARLAAAFSSGRRFLQFGGCRVLGAT